MKTVYSVVVVEEDDRPYVAQGKVFEALDMALELANTTFKKLAQDNGDQLPHPNFTNNFVAEKEGTPSGRLAMFGETEGDVVYIQELKLVEDHRASQRMLLGKKSRELQLPPDIERKVAEMSGIRGH